MDSGKRGKLDPKLDSALEKNERSVADLKKAQEELQSLGDASLRSDSDKSRFTKVRLRLLALPTP